MAILGGDPLFFLPWQSQACVECSQLGKAQSWMEQMKKDVRSLRFRETWGWSGGSAAYCGKWAMAAIHPWLMILMIWGYTWLHYIPNIQYILVDLELSMGTPTNQPVSREDVVAFENSGERSSTCDGFFPLSSWMILHDSTCLVGRPETRRRGCLTWWATTPWSKPSYRWGAVFRALGSGNGGKWRKTV